MEPMAPTTSPLLLPPLPKISWIAGCGFTALLSVLGMTSDVWLVVGLGGAGVVASVLIGVRSLMCRLVIDG